eukprot:scaffold140306_cov53-Attheya_sp.AAC.5
MEKKDICFWTKPLPEVVCGAIKSRLIENDKSIQDMKRADVIIGGNHGQGTFWAILAKQAIICGVNEKKLDSFVVKIGHIDCKKDTYEMSFKTASLVQSTLECNSFKKPVVYTLIVVYLQKMFCKCDICLGFESRYPFWVIANSNYHFRCVTWLSSLRFWASPICWEVLGVHHGIN